MVLWYYGSGREGAVRAGVRAGGPVYTQPVVRHTHQISLSSCCRRRSPCPGLATLSLFATIPAYPN